MLVVFDGLIGQLLPGSYIIFTLLPCQPRQNFTLEKSEKYYVVYTDKKPVCFRGARIKK